jgi:hypothetical protein
MTVNNDFRDPELARSVSNACMIIKHALHDTGVPCYGSPSESTPAQSSSPNGVSKAQIEENWKANASIMNQVSKQLRIEGIKVNIHHDSKNTFNPNNRDLNVDDIWGIEAVPGDTPQATQGSVKIKFAYGQQRTADDIVKEIKNGLGISTKKTTKSLIGSWFSRK